MGTAIALALADLAKGSLGRSDDNGFGGNIIQFALVGLLIIGANKNYLGRETVEPPKWLGTLLAAD